MPGALHALLEELNSADRVARMHAAAYLGDALASGARAGRDVGPIARALLGALMAENDPEVQEELANSLGHLAEYGRVPPELIQPLTKRLPCLAAEAAEHVTGLLEEASWPASGSTS
jgi:hypothetical protein